MAALKIEIVPDSGHPEGGHAIIRLVGLSTVPKDAAFRIDPLEATPGKVMGPGWPVGSREPSDVRMTESGVELRIGPEVVDLPELRPGTPVLVSVPAVGLATQMRWPALSSSPRPIANAETPTKGDDEPLPDTIVALPPKVAPKRDAAGLAELTRKVPRDVGAEPATTASASASNTEPEGAKREPVPAEEPIEMATALRREEVSRALAGLRKPFYPAGVTTKAIVHVPQPEPEPEVEEEAPPPRPRRFGRLAQAGLGVALVAAALVLAWPEIERRVAGPEIDAPPEVVAMISEPYARPDLAAVLRPEMLSPRGESSEAVDREGALLRANAYLHGIDRPVDKAEAAFWLRTAIARDHADPQLRWALTQLGSFYALATPDHTPDYGTAALLWEMAGASGDPVAMCFLGRLQEFGLGQKADKAKARATYESAQRLGGCDGLDAALERVRG